MSFLGRLRTATRVLFSPSPRSQRAYAAAQIGRLYTDWVAGATSADAEIRSSYRRVIDRSRSLERDNDYMRGFLGDCEDNIVGAIERDLRADAGEYIFAKNKVRTWQADILANSIIEEAWDEWSQLGTCTVCGQHTWRDVKNLAVRAVPRDGNFIARKITGPAAGNRFGYALQLWEIDHLDLDKFEPRTREGNEIRFGVEKSPLGRPVAYWLKARHPGDLMGANGTGDLRSIRFSAGEIYHLFVSERPSQSIGMPWVVAAITRLRQLCAFEEAAVIAARLGASKAGWFKTTGESEWTGETDGSGRAVDQVEPGTFGQLPQGWDVAQWNPEYPDINTAVFRKAMLMGVATGLRTSYITLGNDLEAVNYSSARVGIYDERETWKAHQLWFRDHFCKPVFRDWLEAAILAGAINLPLAKFAKFNRPRFKSRRWAYIDPTKEMAANRDALDLKLTSRRQIVDEVGGEIEDTFADIEADQALAATHGIDLTLPLTSASASADSSVAAPDTPPKNTKLASAAN